jgi:glycosylphosphatidylinositol transamidase (GPIT) subunit GPI8
VAETKAIKFITIFIVNHHLIFRYHEIFFMIDTCQAASMYEKFYSPNILAVGSSLVGEDSLSVCIYSPIYYS